MTPQRNRISTAGSAVATFLALCLLAGPAASEQILRFDNGIRATIHTAAEIERDLRSGDDATRVLEGTAAGSVALEADKVVWYPFDTQVVAKALATMAGFHADVDVDVYILPAPPAEVGSSFARRDAIYLSPGFGPVKPETVASITAHEMGHVLTWAFVDGKPGRWDAYSELRGLDPAVHRADARHAWRPREILAEDLRFLFGGLLATSTGTIENAELATPDRVEGLEELLVSFLQDPGVAARPAVAMAFPNPCNPRTSIHLSLPPGASTSVAAKVVIFDIRGARVRTITGGRFANDAVTVQWDGTGEGGGLVASGRYMYVISASGQTARGSVTLVR
ncbi:MAG: hypothetical protein GY838_08280 [bacterium]|nr:hypothetical protein [bacterium]